MNTDKKMSVRLSVFICAYLWLTPSTSRAADTAPPPVLHLTNGGFIPGALRGANDLKVLRWQSPVFTRPLEFPLSAVKAVHYPGTVVPPPAGEYCFELVDGDIIFGDLLALTADEVEVNSAPQGRLHLLRDKVRRFYRRAGADSIYLGPTGLAGWTSPAGPVQWQDEGGQLYSNQRGATIFGDLGIPDKALIEVEISWKAKPDFVFALGVDAGESLPKNAFRFEVWDGELVVVGESPRDADMAIVDHAGNLGGEVRVQVCLDQQQRRLILLSRTGKPLATLNIVGPKPPVRAGVRLTNGKGDVRLEHLRVTRWNGVPPRDVRDDQARLHRIDGSIVYGQLAAYDPESKAFTVRDGGMDTVVSHEAVADIFLAPARFKGSDPADAAAAQSIRAVYRDGSRFSGTLARVEDERLTLICAGVKEPLQLPLALVRSLIPLRHGQSADVPVAEGRSGRLESAGLSLKGRLGATGDNDADGRMVWQPDLGINASPLVAGLSGRIVYRDPPPPPPPAPVAGQANQFQVQLQLAPAAGVAGVVGRIFSGQQPAVVTRRTAAGRPAMHLRTGDTIPCEVTRINEKGVTFKAPQSDATFVAHEKIKSIDLIAPWQMPEVDEAKRDRLLMLPRMQKDSPPTHLIVSRSGDFLRGRIVEMDDERLKVEVRLEAKDIPRDRVAQIIWLHPDELGDKKVADGPPAGSETRAQAINANGNRLTFVVGKADDKTISGSSDVLGACRANLAEVDQLLFGSAIEQSAADLTDHQWRLHHAPEPKFVQAGEGATGDGGTTGIESPLVGQPAPTFQLEMLDGTKYKLADHKGKVVVLDFWATWCGPCIQSMPQVDEIARSFADRGVELLAIDMEEQPDAVKSMLERHKLKMPVAIDRDGAVAPKYAVTAIPQTVVIDRDGKVARLFVGGGKATADALRKALEELAVPKAAVP